MNILSLNGSGLFENGAYWYLVPGKSFGFAPSSNISLGNFIDTFDCRIIDNKWSCEDDDRLSWTLNGGPGKLLLKSTLF